MVYDWCHAMRKLAPKCLHMFFGSLPPSAYISGHPLYSVDHFHVMLISVSILLTFCHACLGICDALPRFFIVCESLYQLSSLSACVFGNVRCSAKFFVVFYCLFDTSDILQMSFQTLIGFCRMFLLSSPVPRHL